jgi:hypothetical protein
MARAGSEAADDGYFDDHFLPWIANARRDGYFGDHVEKPFGYGMLASSLAAGGSREGEGEGAVHVL